MTSSFAYQTSKFKDEAEAVATLLQSLYWPAGLSQRVQDKTIALVEKVRLAQKKNSVLEGFLQQYPLDSEEGRALMSLAEAYLRVPDTATRNALIKDRLNAADWDNKKNKAADWYTRFAGAGLSASKGTLNSMLGVVGEPFIRKGVEGAMKMMGQQFVLGESIEKALQIAAKNTREDYSFDMLGEGARTAEDAERYFESYAHAIRTIGAKRGPKPAGISVKLSALYPRYEIAQRTKCFPTLCERLRALCLAAAKENIALTVDAEEADRLDISLEIFDHVLRSIPKDWQKMGLAVQAYQKRSFSLLDHIEEMAQQSGRKIRVRLVKGAYWDSEIKHAQVLGHPDFPVFTRKCNTDLSYLACAQKMLQECPHIYPMFATHNAHTICAIIVMADSNQSYEFQRLHGMGEALYEVVQKETPVTVTVYAPVGPHKDLLPYLVRRLLENGANSSFIHKLNDVGTTPDQLASDPVFEARKTENKRHSFINLPDNLYKNRKNAGGRDLTDQNLLKSIQESLTKFRPSIALHPHKDTPIMALQQLFSASKRAAIEWRNFSSDARATILEKLADLIQINRNELLAYLVFEAQKTIPDAETEIRETIDFCRFYAEVGRRDFNEAGHKMSGPTGEDNTLIHVPRGIFVCISPWNFPLAIFTGQIAAALMAGNTVIAKPAEQTPRIAAKMLELCKKAGLPQNTLQIAYGDGEIGSELVLHKDVAGVAFTGSTAVAKRIQMALAAKDGPITPLIAETGGQNAMIVDSSALPEQVVDDVIHSAFGSAGQRCSALRVLYLQNEIADSIIKMLQGAMQELVVGLPDNIMTDIPPVIDGEAHNRLTHHKKFLDANARKISEVPLLSQMPSDLFFFAPCAYEIKSIDVLEGEVFGPILHVIRFNIESLDHVLEEITQTGYGLTFGLHSRINSRWKQITSQVPAGNIYINRGMTGAVVGCQPFGGCGLSGTGPKAGGPNYLKAFATEKVITANTTASGGNATLVSMRE
jgi:RHH-type proline utilization regulon transcriptional repressor/proline dehydrogenase/delta 1-pyrroline-5-carboxylate dehydrogenase